MFTPFVAVSAECVVRDVLARRFAADKGSGLADRRHSLDALQHRLKETMVVDLQDVSMPQQRGTLDVSRSRRTRRAICRRTSRTGLQRVAWSNTTNKSSAIRFRGASENAFVLTTPASLEVGASLSQPPL